MNELLLPLAQAFLIPIAILFCGVCVSCSSLQRAFLSLIGLAFSVALLITTTRLPGSVTGVAETGLLSVFLGIAWLIHGVVQLVQWLQDRKQRSPENQL